MPLLTIRNATKTFGGVAAVKDVSLSVEAGEILGIMGPNGSGKTTLFNLVSGALAPDAGKFSFKTSGSMVYLLIDSVIAAWPEPFSSCAHFSA